MGKRISQLAEITTVDSDDLLNVVDVSDTTYSASGTNKKATLSKFLDFFYPVGTIYETTSSNLDTVDKMNAHFGGTWEVFGEGRVLVAKSSDTEFDTIGKTGGEKYHTLTIAEMPHHSHGQLVTANPNTGGPGIRGDFNGAEGTGLSGYPQGISTSGEGGGGTHNNLPPYQVVYRYRRTA